MTVDGENDAASSTSQETKLDNGQLLPALAFGVAIKSDRQLGKFVASVAVSAKAQSRPVWGDIFAACKKDNWAKESPAQEYPA